MNAENIQIRAIIEKRDFFTDTWNMFAVALEDPFFRPSESHSDSDSYDQDETLPTREVWKGPLITTIQDVTPEVFADIAQHTQEDGDNAKVILSQRLLPSLYTSQDWIRYESLQRLVAGTADTQDTLKVILRKRLGKKQQPVFDFIIGDGNHRALLALHNQTTVTAEIVATWDTEQSPESPVKLYGKIRPFNKLIDEFDSLMNGASLEWSSN